MTKDVRRKLAAARVGEIPPGAWKVIQYVSDEGEEKEMVLFNLDGRYYAIDNICPHGAFRLSNGLLEGEGVICPGHGWLFSVRDGRCMSREFEPVTTYRVEVSGDIIEIVYSETDEQ